MADETPYEEADRLQAHLVALDAFLSSPAHVSYVAAKKQEVNEFVQQIVDNDITDIPSLFNLLDIRGRIKVANDDVTLFDAARTNVIARLAEIADEKQQLATEYKP